MSRTMTPEMADALRARLVRPVMFVALEFADSTDRFWSGTGTTQWDGEAWTGRGALLGLSPIEETAAVRATGVVFTITGLDPDYIGQALAQARLGKSATIWLGGRDDAGAMILDPVLLFTGYMDVPTIDADPASMTIRISAENRLIDLQRTRERRYTHEDQQIVSPGDLGFEYVPSLVEWNGKWGRA